MQVWGEQTSEIIDYKMSMSELYHAEKKKKQLVPGLYQKSTQGT